MTEPRFVWYMILANVSIFVIGVMTFYHNEVVLAQLINYPSDLLSFRWHTFITAGFLHANLLHLVGNMIALFIFGRIVEREYGSATTIYLYSGALILSGLFSAIVHLILGENPGGVGASGAIMGLVAIAMLTKPFYLTYYAIIPLPIMVYGWLYLIADLSGVFSGVDSGIGHFAHLGGFLSITLLMYLLSPERRKKLKNGLWINMASVVLFIGFIGLLGII